MSSAPAAPAPARAREDRRPGDWLVRAGAVCFLVGAVATLATVTPLFLGADPLPTAAYLTSMLMPVGFALGLAGLVRSARRRPPRG
nr:hypothetical protein [Allostreptomyces psammosilenae]